MNMTAKTEPALKSSELLLKRCLRILASPTCSLPSELSCGRMKRTMLPNEVINNSRQKENIVIRSSMQYIDSDPFGVTGGVHGFSRKYLLD